MLVLHLLVVVLVTTSLLPRVPRGPVRQPWFTVTLPASREAPTAVAVRAPEPQTAPARPRTPAAAPRPQAITLPATAAPVAAPALPDSAPATPAEPRPVQAPTARPAPETEGAPAPPPPLDLRLPPRPTREPPGTAPSMARQAVEAQVGAIGWRSAEARMAHRLEAEWTVETLGDGRIRMRRGEQCVMLKETQASQLDPWNLRGPPPRGAGPCP